MRIICNRPGGFNFFGLHFQEGENIVENEIWTSVKAKLNPKFLQALTESRGEIPPELILLDDAGKPPMTAKEKITLIERCGSIEELAQYEADETCKTVLVAIERRLQWLADAERIEEAG